MNRTKGLAAMSPKRRAELAAAGITHPSSTFASPDKPNKPVKRNGTKPADTGPDRATVDAVIERDNWSCTVCGDPLHGYRGGEWSIHHRKLRSQGGDNRLSNLISVCGHGTVGCHSAIHAAPKRASDAGWIVLREEEPEQKRMAHSQHGWVLLDNQGGRERVEPPHDPMQAAMPAGKEF